MPRRPVLFAVPLSALAFLAAGCGGGGGSDSTSTSAWADDLCSAMTTWTQSLTEAGTSIQGTGLSKASIQNAVDDAKSSTQTLVDELQGLVRPDTQAGADAQDAVNELADDLDGDLADIQNAIDNSSTTVGAITAVTNTLTTMSNQVTSTFTELEQLDAKGELEAAFENADSCQALVG